MYRQCEVGIAIQAIQRRLMFHVSFFKRIKRKLYKPKVYYFYWLYIYREYAGCTQAFQGTSSNIQSVIPS